jgi:hypothetical protein
VSNNDSLEIRIQVEHLRMRGLVVELRLAKDQNQVETLLDTAAQLLDKDTVERAGAKARYTVSDLEISELSVNAELLPVKPATVRVDLPDIRLTNIGDVDGITITRLSEMIAQAVFTSLTEQAKGDLPRALATRLVRRFVWLKERLKKLIA